MADKTQDQFDHMLALQGLRLARAGAVFENHAEGVAVRDIEKCEGGNSRVDVHWVQTGAEIALCDPAFIHCAHGLNGIGIESLDALALTQILAALEIHRAELSGVVIESTYNWYWLVDGLQAAGYREHVRTCKGVTNM